MSVRISLIERLAVEADGTSLDEQRFPGRQGRIVFAYLVVQKGRAVPRDELADVLWSEKPPATWEKALRVLMTKLRALLEECGIDRSTGLTSAFGCYTLTLPEDAWIDVDSAATAIGRAEAALAAADLDEARAQAATAAAVCRPTFLPGEDGAWVEEQRRDLRDLLVRALECLRDASLAAGEFRDAARHAAEIVDLEPFRESSYRALMQAHAAAGNPAEALRVYERCRVFLGEELGAYPSAETEAVYLEILRSSSGTTAAEVDRAGDAPSGAELPPTPPPTDEPPRRGRRRVATLATAAVLVAVAAVAAGLAFSSRDKARVAPVVIRPNSLVRIDSKTLKPTLDHPIGKFADLVVATGGYVWVNHWSLRYQNNRGVQESGDRALTRFNPATNTAENIGGLAPCGITPDPSGDIWVANCFTAGLGGPVSGNVRLVHARTKKFGLTKPLPTVYGYYRGMVFGGGSLWLAGVSGNEHKHPEDLELLRLDPETSTLHKIHLQRAPTTLAWSPQYEDLWMSNCGDGSVTRRNAVTRKVTTFDGVSSSPCPTAVGDDGALWVGDWASTPPHITRIPADGSGPPQGISLPRAKFGPGGVPSIAKGAGFIWVAVPDDHSVFRIDPRHPTRPPKRIFLHYAPWGVTVDDTGAIWVTLRGSTTNVN